MPDWSSFAAYRAEIDKLITSMDTAGRAKITRPMGEKAKQIAEAELGTDLGGDMKFTHWAPVAELTLKQTSDGATVLLPTKTGAGPITVIDQGRNRGNAAGFAGPGINKRSGLTSRTKSGGLRKVRAVRGKRWNGVTEGKGTAARAVSRIESEMPRVAEDGLHKLLVRHFDVT